MPAVEVNQAGEYKFTFEPEGVPANPTNAREMSDGELDQEHFRRLKNDPTFEERVAPKSWIFHDEISCEREVEGCYGKRCGNQGSGRLREVIATRPSGSEFLDIFFDDTAAYMGQWTPERPDPDVWFEQYETLRQNYHDNGALVHEVIVPKEATRPTHLATGGRRRRRATAAPPDLAPSGRAEREAR